MGVGRRIGLPLGLAAGVAALGVGAGCSTSRSVAPPPTIPPLTAAATAGPPSSTNASTSATTNAPTSPSAGPTPATDPVLPAPTTAAGGSGPVSLAPISAAEWAAVDAALRDRLLDRGDFAFSYAVSVDGVPVHAGASGIRNAPDIVLPPPETVPGSGPTLPTVPTTTTTLPGVTPEEVATTDRFRIASISKVLTGTVVLQLVADGVLSLDQPVGTLIADHVGVDVAGQPAESITVRQLLAHTAGFGVFRRTFFERGVETCPEAARRGFSNGLQFAPGTTYHYSNMNYCVLSQLIEVITGQPYEQVVKDRLLSPLGISGMRLAGTIDPDPDEVVHPSSPGRNYMEVLGGAGAWVATPADIVKIVDSLDTTRPGWHPLPAELSGLMRQAVPGIAYDDPLERWYGLATIVFANQSWGHTGTIENTHTVVLHRPDGMTWALFVSGNEPVETDDLVGIFQAALDEAGIDAPAPTTSTTTTTTTTTVAPPPTVAASTVAATSTTVG